MISKLKKELQNRKKDNRGAALVLVIITIAFVGMLVAMILYMAYNNYLMKSNDRIAKDNFYSAEYALDVINAGLQMDVSECMAEAYVKTVNDSSGQDPDAMEIAFKKTFSEKVITKLQQKGTDVNGNPTVDPTKWDVSHLTDFWAMNNLQVQTTPGAQGACMDVDVQNDKNILEVSTHKQYITLRNIKIVYTDAKGYVSIIKTDIRIRVPKLEFAQASGQLNLENFSLIANDALINNTVDPLSPTASHPTTIGSDNVAITGNVFGGYKGVMTGNHTKTSFVKSAADNETTTYYLIADSLNVDNSLTNGLSVSKEFSTYVDNINVTSSELKMEGMTFVGDDMDVAGKESVVHLGHEHNGCKTGCRSDYIGYGNLDNQADGSSSILINGGGTTIDFEYLDKLMLSGHAYVGAKKYDADVDRLAYGLGVTDTTTITSDVITDEEKYNQNTPNYVAPQVSANTTIPKNEMDFMMGESVSVKANQLMYMVPVECIGYKASTDVQVIAKNPMTYEEYSMLVNTEEAVLDENGNEKYEDGEKVTQKVYEPVRLEKLWEKLKVVPLTSDYKAVYRRLNGQVYVYLYLDFGVNQELANDFYKAYYEYDKEGIDNYVSSYVKDMTWNTNLTSNLTLAGNAFYMEDTDNDGFDDVQFIDDDLDDADKYNSMLSLQTEYSRKHESLMHSLSPVFENMTYAQQSSEIFDSLVDRAVLVKMDGEDFTNGSIKARIIDGDVVYPSIECPAETNLIVATGNIYLKSNFEGLAMAGKKQVVDPTNGQITLLDNGGHIYICNGCTSVNYNPTKVLQAMRAKVTDATTGTDMYVYEVFGASGVLSYGMDGTQEDDGIKLSDLILYENWKKE